MIHPKSLLGGLTTICLAETAESRFMGAEEKISNAGARVSTEEVDEKTIVERARSGDRRAFQHLVETYQQRAFRIALGVLKSREDAEDVVQESFVKAHLSLDKFRGQSSFYTWLYRIVFNMAIDVKRRRGRQGGDKIEFDEGVLNSDGVDSSLLGRVEDPHAAFTRKEQGTRIRAALDQLSVEHRTVIMLREFDGMSYEDIARITGATKGTVMSRLHYARKKMQTLLSDSEEFDEKGNEEAGSIAPPGSEGAGLSKRQSVESL